MKKASKKSVKKKKVAVRRGWKINPVTRVAPSDKTYSRSRARSDARRESDLQNEN